MRTLAPLDTETILASVRKTAKAMVVYEDNRTYGAGAEIVATIAEEAMFDLDAPIVRIGGPDIPAMPYASSLEHLTWSRSRTTSTRGCAPSRGTEPTRFSPASGPGGIPAHPEDSSRRRRPRRRPATSRRPPPSAP